MVANTFLNRLKKRIPVGLSLFPFYATMLSSFITISFHIFLKQFVPSGHYVPLNKAPICIPCLPTKVENTVNALFPGFVSNC